MAWIKALYEYINAVLFTLSKYARPSLTTTEELRREPTGVVGRELREELALKSSELRLSEPSLSPLLMELLSSHLG